MAVMVPLLVLLLLSSALAFDDLDYDDDDLRNTTTTTLTSTSTTISTSTTTNQPTERSAEPDLTDLRQSFSELEKENEKLEDNRVFVMLFFLVHFQFSWTNFTMQKMK
jgi:hypothetical protein